MKNKLITMTFLICVVLCIFIFPHTANAATEGNYTYTVSNGEATITDFVTSVKGEIIIPDSLGGYPVTSIGEAAFAYCKSLKSINIPNNVAYIGDSAFYGCSSLTSINIPNSVTSIGDFAFGGCSSLTSINIPDSVTSIGDFTFNNCSSLTNITIPNSVTSIGYYAFDGCSSLTSINIPDSVTSIGDNAFNSCSSLTSINIPDSVTSIGDKPFGFCFSLTNILVDVNNNHYSSLDGNLYDKSKRTLIQYAPGKKKLDFSVSDSVTSIEKGAFSGCSSLTNITIPNSVTSIGDSAFYSCTSLASITIPDSVTSIGDFAFNNCSSLTSVNIPDSVTSIGDYAFCRCSSLTSINIPDSVTSIGDSAFNNCSSLTRINIPNSVTSIGNSAFYYCESLKTVYYRGTQSQWNNIKIGSSNYYLTDANIITDCIFVHIFNENGEEVAEIGITSGSKFNFETIPQKEGYTYKLYSDKEMTKEISVDFIFTEDTTAYGKYVINQYTYKFVDDDENEIKTVTADYGTIIELPENVPLKENPYVFDNWNGYYAGMALSHDISFNPKFKFGMNRFEINGADAIKIGDKANYTIKLATDKDIQYATIFIKYPNELILESATSDTFADIIQEKVTTEGEYTTAEYLCIYSYGSECIPKETVIDALNITFRASTAATPKDVEIELTEDSILMGDVDYKFESADKFKMTILPKLAEEIIINGDAAITENGKFTATILPDYTSDKSVTWSVDNEEIAEISQEGVLTGKKNGTVTITAVSNSNPNVKATKAVTVSVYAQINSLVTDGYMTEEFNPTKYEYTIYVDENAEVITLSPAYVYGRLTANGTTILSGRSKEIALTDEKTVITLNRTNVSEFYLNESTYTLTVIKDNSALITDIEKSDSGYKLEITLNKNKIADFKTADVLIALFDGNKLIKVQTVKIESEESSLSLNVTTDKEATSYKILLLDGTGNLKPLCIKTEKSIKE